MGEKQGETEENGAIVGGELQQWSQLPNESAQAHAGLLAYAVLPLGKRTITAAYRALKGMPEDADVKPPGYFGAWTSKYRWRQRAAARDQIFNQLAVVAPMQERAAADKRTVETANRLHDIIESELGALESAARARLIALREAESDYE